MIIKCYIWIRIAYMLNQMNHEKYIEILEKNIDIFGKDIGQIEPECLDNPIQEGVFYLQKVIVIFVKMIYQTINIK